MNYAGQSLVIFADTLIFEYEKRIFLELYECNNRLKEVRFILNGTGITEGDKNFIKRRWIVNPNRNVLVSSLYC